jgi:hypothetical protein
VSETRGGGWIVPLPEAKWRKCSWCLGKGTMTTQRTMHQPPRVIPCPVIGCDGGIVKKEAISSMERTRRQGR